jgi:tetratricopeptide (TPR) repeat protein
MPDSSRSPSPIRAALASDPVLAAVIFMLLFTLYSLGAARTIYVGDSGELVTAVALLGIPHPTGYPLYVLLGKLWTILVPVGSVALRMSLASAACAAAAAAGIYLLARSAALTRPAALTGALVLAFSPSFWSQANVQRVYSLNALFVVLALASAWRWDRTRSDRWLVLTVFLAALGSSNHTFMAIFGAAFALFTLASEPALLRRPGLLGPVIAAGVAGLLPYLYLPLRSRADPRLDWGNPETLDAFLAVVLRRDFWNRRWLEGPTDLVPILGDWLTSTGAELTWVGVGLAVVGAVAYRRRAPVLLLALVVAANVGSMALHGSRSDLFIWHRYYIPSYVVLALLVGMGCDALLRTAAGRWRRTPAWVVAPIPLLVPIVLFATGWRDFDRSRYRVAEDFSRTLLDTLPPGSHLAASDDNILFTLLYLHFVEGLRPDLDLIPQGVGEAALPPLRFDPEREGLYFTHHPNWDHPGLDVVPVGLAFLVQRAGRPWPEPRIPKTSLDGEDDPRVPKDHLTRNLIGHFHYMLGITWEQRDWLRARSELERAATIAHRNDVLFYNLGLIYRRNGLFERSLAAFTRSHEINPRHLASQQRALARERLRETEAELERIRAVEEELARELGLDDRDPVRYHAALARALAERGETTAARGHRLLALESESAGPGAPTPTSAAER